jgi:hypothetical protein
MGFEAITIDIESSADPASAARLLDSLGFQKRGGKSASNATLLECVTPNFIIEAALKPKSSGISALRIELALCNPSEADPFFATVVDGALSLGAFRLWFMTSLQPGIHFDSSEHSPEEILRVLRQQLVGLRSKWQLAFGNKTGPVRIAEAYAFVGVI